MRDRPSGQAWPGSAPPLRPRHLGRAGMFGERRATGPNVGPQARKFGRFRGCVLAAWCCIRSPSMLTTLSWGPCIWVVASSVGMSPSITSQVPQGSIQDGTHGAPHGLEITGALYTHSDSTQDQRLRAVARTTGLPPPGRAPCKAAAPAPAVALLLLLLLLLPLLPWRYCSSCYCSWYCRSCRGATATAAPAVALLLLPLLPWRYCSRAARSRAPSSSDCDMSAPGCSSRMTRQPGLWTCGRGRGHVWGGQRGRVGECVCVRVKG